MKRVLLDRSMKRVLGVIFAFIFLMVLAVEGVKLASTIKDKEELALQEQLMLLAQGLLSSSDDSYSVAHQFLSCEDESNGLNYNDTVGVNSFKYSKAFIKELNRRAEAMCQMYLFERDRRNCSPSDNFLVDCCTSEVTDGALTAKYYAPSKLWKSIPHDISATGFDWRKSRYYSREVITLPLMNKYNRKDIQRERLSNGNKDTPVIIEPVGAMPEDLFECLDNCYTSGFKNVAISFFVYGYRGEVEIREPRFVRYNSQPTVYPHGQHDDMREYGLEGFVDVRITKKNELFWRGTEGGCKLFGHLDRFDIDEFERHLGKTVGKCGRDGVKLVVTLDPRADISTLYKVWLAARKSEFEYMYMRVPGSIVEEDGSKKVSYNLFKISLILPPPQIEDDEEFEKEESTVPVEVPKKSNEQTVDAKLEELRAENEGLKSENEDLRTENFRLKSEDARLKDTIEGLKKQIETIKEELLYANDDLECTKKELDEVKERLSNAEKMNVSEVSAKATEVTTAQETTNEEKNEETGIATSGEKGKVVNADNANQFVIVELSEKISEEYAKINLQDAHIELCIRRPGYNGNAGEFIGRIRLRNVVKGKAYVIADILSAWSQDEIKAGDVVFAD